MSLLYGLFGIAMGIQDTAGGALMVDIHPESPVRLNDMHFLFGIGNITAPLVFQFLVSEGVIWNHVFYSFRRAGGSGGCLPAGCKGRCSRNKKSDAEIENTGINIKRIAAFLKADGNIFLFFAMFLLCASDGDRGMDPAFL